MRRLRLLGGGCLWRIVLATLIAASVVVANDPDQDHFRDLLLWLGGGGGQSVEITLTTFAADFRGVHTVAAITNRSRIMAIPRAHLLTDQVARQSPIGQAIAHAGYVPRNVQSLLAAMLCEQRELMLHSDARRTTAAAAGAGAGAAGGADSATAVTYPDGIPSVGSVDFWFPYLRVLPRDFPTLPIFYSEAELDWLTGSAALQNIATLQTDVRSEFDQLQARVPAFRRFEYRTFLWARLAVMTRAFSVYVNRAKCQAMIPLADMLNHHMLASKLQWGFDDNAQGFVLTAVADYSAGDQLYLSYGSKSNTALLVDYGFVLPDNPWQSVVVVMKLPFDAPLFNTKMLFFDDTTQYVRMFSSYSHKDTQTAFAVARFICGTHHELTPLLRSNKFKLSDVTPLSAANEMCALKLIAAAATAKVASYPRTLARDEELLEADRNGTASLSVNIRNCLHVTRSEKQVLALYERMGRDIAPLLNVSWAELGHAHALRQWTDFNEYVSLVVVPLVFRASFGGRLSRALSQATIGLGHHSGRQWVLKASAVAPHPPDRFNATDTLRVADQLLLSTNDQTTPQRTPQQTTADTADAGADAHSDRSTAYRTPSPTATAAVRRQWVQLHRARPHLTTALSYSVSHSLSALLPRNLDRALRWLRQRRSRRSRRRRDTEIAPFESLMHSHAAWTRLSRFLSHF